VGVGGLMNNEKLIINNFFVIPAEAGISSLVRRTRDSRLRGNDKRGEYYDKSKKQNHHRELEDEIKFGGN
jgi:hypothetical protein